MEMQPVAEWTGDHLAGFPWCFLKDGPGRMEGDDSHSGQRSRKCRPAPSLLLLTQFRTENGLTLFLVLLYFSSNSRSR